MSTFITINGALGKDPVSNDVGNHKVARFNLASSSYDSKTKQYTTKWYNVEIWGTTVNFVMSKLRTGSKVLVFGEYIQSSYVDKNDKKVEASYVKAAKIELIAEPKQQDQRQQQNQQQNQQQPGLEDIPF